MDVQLHRKKGSMKTENEINEALEEIHRRRSDVERDLEVLNRYSDHSYGVRISRRILNGLEGMTAQLLLTEALLTWTLSDEKAVPALLPSSTNAIAGGDSYSYVEEFASPLRRIRNQGN